MGIYIKDWTMPTSCSNCKIQKSCKIVIKKLNTWDGDDRGYWLPANYRHENCPLVEIEIDV